MSYGAGPQGGNNPQYGQGNPGDFYGQGQFQQQAQAQAGQAVANAAPGIASSMLENYLGFLHPKNWRIYFDFDDSEIRTRIFSSISPVTTSLSNAVKNKPDFYGPVWYLITLVFALSVLSNFSRYLNYLFFTSNRNEAQMKAVATFHFAYFAKAIVVAVGSWAVAPLTFMLGLKILGQDFAQIAVAELYCIWGYSYIYYILAAVVSTLPVNVNSFSPQAIIFFAFVAAAGLASLFLLTQFSAYLQRYEGNSKYVLLALVVGWQALIFFAFKFAFFPFNA